MGAEQVGYIVKGPRKISESRIRAAVCACRRLRRKLLKLCAGIDDSYTRTEVVAEKVGEYFDPEEIPENPESVIRDFVAWWHHIEGRDTCSRSDPDDSRQVLVYAGEMSWGDEPQGYGFQKLKQAFGWGFAEALGVR